MSSFTAPCRTKTYYSDVNSCPHKFTDRCPQCTPSHFKIIADDAGVNATYLTKAEEEAIRNEIAALKKENEATKIKYGYIQEQNIALESKLNCTNAFVDRLCNLLKK